MMGMVLGWMSNDLALLQLHYNSIQDHICISLHSASRIDFRDVFELGIQGLDVQLEFRDEPGTSGICNFKLYKRCVLLLNPM